MWMDIAIIALFIVAIYGFIEMVGLRTRALTRKTHLRAEDLYERFGDSPREQRRYAKEHGGEWQADDSFRLGNPKPAPRESHRPQ